MRVIEDNTERTIVVFRPRAWPLLALFLGLTGAAGFAWRTTSRSLWLIAALVLFLLSIAMLLALCFNRRTVAFDWARQSVDTRGHNWNPLFKDEVEHQSLAGLASWTVTQENNRLGRAGRVWTVGFERTAGLPVEELLFERSLVEARCKALLLAQHNGHPVTLISPLDTFPGNASRSADNPFGPATDRHPRMSAFQPGPRPRVVVETGANGRLLIQLPTDRRKIPARGGLTLRWPLLLLEAVACLTVAICLPLAQSRPHPLYALALVYALVGLPIFCIGWVCLWIGLGDLTGRTRIEVFGGMLRLTQSILGGLPCRRIEVPASKCEAALVAKTGYNPCLLVLIARREYCVGAGLPATELLQARHALTRAVAAAS